MGETASDRPASIEVTFDAASHSVNAIQRAAYRFSDRFSCELVSGEVEHRCVLTVVGDIDLDAQIADFRTEVLDQVLRERIRAETEPIRTMILAQAFSKTGIVDPQGLA
jgi:His-Xaa-Ser system protein HxsD